MIAITVPGLVFTHRQHNLAQFCVLGRLAMCIENRLVTAVIEQQFDDLRLAATNCTMQRRAAIVSVI